MKIIKRASIIVFLFITGTLFAQQKVDVISKNVFESLATPDSLTNATVIIHQDKRIEQLIVKKKTFINSQGQISESVFRVQVFSSNTQRTAKNEAFKIEKQIKELFPNMPVYVNYTSPFWKVRIGDFTTKGEALAFRLELIEVLPEIRTEAYIVRDQTNIAGSK